MTEPNGRIFINKDSDGVITTDITGLLYLLREKKVEPNSLIEAFSKNSFTEGKEMLIDTYTVEETTIGDYILSRQEDDDFAIELDFYLDLGEGEIDLNDMFEFDFPMNFELDELTVGAKYLIYPADEVMNGHIYIISFNEALKRIEKGQTVYLDFMSDNKFKPIDSDVEITADMLIEGIWGITTKEEDSFKEDPKKIKKVNPFEESVDTLGERMNQHLLKNMKPKNLNDKEKDDLIEDLMNMFFKDDIDNLLDDDIIE